MIAVVASLGRPTPDPKHITHHTHGVGCEADGRVVDVVENHRHLGERQPEAFGQVKHLDVEGKSVDERAAEDQVGGVAATVAIGVGVAFGLAIRMRERKVPPSEWTPPER